MKYIEAYRHKPVIKVAINKKFDEIVIGICI